MSNSSLTVLFDLPPLDPFADCLIDMDLARLDALSAAASASASSVSALDLLRLDCARSDRAVDGAEDDELRLRGGLN